MERRILVFHNPFAAKGKSNRGLVKILGALQQKGLEHRVLETVEGFEGNAERLTATAQQFKPTEIWLSGGDGTLHLFINSLPQHLWRLPLAVIPTGTGNDFVKNYIHRPTVENCLYAALNGTPQPFDVWQCNGRLFAHGLGIGFDGRVVERMAKGKTPFGGFLAYYYHVLALLFTYREKTFTLAANGSQKVFDCFLVTVGNGHTFGGGFKITPNARINDEVLDVCAISCVNILARPRYLKSVEKGRHLHLPIVDYFNAQTLTLTAPETVPGHIDGELFYGDVFEIGPHAERLNVFGL